MFYLLKTEPSAYSFADLQRDQTTIWDGVTNPVALKHLRGFQLDLTVAHRGERGKYVGGHVEVSWIAGIPTAAPTGRY